MKTRLIRPSFWTNDKLAECSPMARLFYVGLWAYADREGRFEIRPKKMQVEILPYDTVHVATLLEELKSHGFIITWVVDGCKFGEIANFTKHQTIHKHEARSTIPDKPENAISDEVLDAPPVHVATCTDMTGVVETLRPLVISNSNSSSNSNSNNRSTKELSNTMEVFPMIFLTLEEQRKLVEKYGAEKATEACELLSAWIGAKVGQLAWFNKKYSSAFNVLYPKTSWVWREIGKQAGPTKSKRQATFDSWLTNAMSDVEKEKNRQEEIPFFETLTIEGN